VTYLWLFVGGLILAWWVSRLIIRLTGTRRRIWGLAGVHLATFVALATTTGLMRGGLNTFDYWSLPIFGVAALIWLRYDIVRRNVN
jgi:hypothetical protein